MPILEEIIEYRKKWDGAGIKTSTCHILTHSQFCEHYQELIKKYNLFHVDVMKDNVRITIPL